MIPIQQRYSIYDQELLTLVLAIEECPHLLRIAKATAYTDHRSEHFESCSEGNATGNGIAPPKRQHICENLKVSVASFSAKGSQDSRLKSGHGWCIET